MSLIKSIKSDAFSIFKINWLKLVSLSFIWMLIILLIYWIEFSIYLFTNINIFHLVPIYDEFSVMHQVYSFSSYSFLLPFVITSTIVSIVFGSIFSVLIMGNTLFYYSTIYQKQNNLSTLFDYFSSLSRILKSIAISIQLFFRQLFWALIIFLPSIAILIWTIFATFNQNHMNNTFLIAFGYILFFCLYFASYIFYIIFCQRYALVKYLIVSGECNKIRQAIKRSINIMNGKKLKYTLFVISFIPWFLSCLFFFPIFFVIPYFNLSSSLYFRYLVEDYNLKTSL